MLNILNKIALQKEWQFSMTDNVFAVDKYERKNNKTSKQKILVRVENQIRDLWHSSLKTYLSTTYTTEHIDCTLKKYANNSDRQMKTLHIKVSEYWFYKHF